ncbi:MAG: AAA domain-containing protein [Desulfobacterales bacterium]|nr:AAA domain-containing protein [Desulfobacterales bacterium]
MQLINMIRAIFIGLSLVTMIVFIAPTKPTEEDRLVQMENRELGEYYGDPAAGVAAGGNLVVIALWAAGLGLVVSAFGPWIAKRAGSLELPFVRKSELKKWEEGAEELVRFFQKDVAEILAALEGLADAAKSLARARKERENDFHVETAEEDGREHALRAALCGDFPPFPGDVFSGEEIRVFPLDAVGSSPDATDVDVVLVADDRIDACSGDILKLGKPVLVASDNPRARIEAYNALHDLALFYTPYERLREPNHLVAEMDSLDRVERATRFKMGRRRLITLSPEILREIENIERNFHGAMLHSSILLLGETGVGKELMANLICRLCGRRMTPLNVADPADGLWSDELFGHNKGAFTGATESRKGAMELAHDEALFLDEVGDMPPRFQGLLLRALAEKVFQRIGGRSQLKSNHLLISATNKDIDALVKSGLFRRDMFMRLHGVRCCIPPLAQRVYDIPLLVRFFHGGLIGRTGSYIRLSESFVKSLYGYPFKGNVRELESVLTAAF